MNTKNTSRQSGLMKIGQILVSDAQTISEKWMEWVRHEVVSASFAHRAELKNMIPKFIKALGEELCQTQDQMIGRNMLARDHGLQRWDAGWKLREIIADYQMLQIVLFEHVGARLGRPFDTGEINKIGSYIDESIMIAVTTFTKQSEAELRDLNESLEKRVIERTRLAENTAAKLKRASRELIKAKQNERERIARILHDDLQQLLASCRMRLEGMREGPRNEVWAADLSALSEIIAEAQKVTRNLALELRPPVDSTRIVKTVEWLQKRMPHEFGLQLTLGEYQNDVLVDQEIGLVVYQSLRELLFNVVKHGKCREAAIDVAVENTNEEKLVVTVSDHGAGFDASLFDKLSEGSGFGLSYIRDRLEMIGGKLDIWSSIGNGTRVTLKLPLNLI